MVIGITILIIRSSVPSSVPETDWVLNKCALDMWVETLCVDGRMDSRWMDRWMNG